MIDVNQSIRAFAVSTTVFTSGDKISIILSINKPNTISFYLSKFHVNTHTHTTHTRARARICKTNERFAG